MAKRDASRERTLGFGVPDIVDPHHFVVRIPRGDGSDIEIVENFGLNAASEDEASILRCRLSRAAWNGVREEARRVLNERLKDKGLTTSRWSAGENKVERLLGRELCLLAWSVEAARSIDYPAACAAWAGLKPEEKWWLFRMCDQAVGAADDVDLGWRKAVRIAFTETPGPLTVGSHDVSKRKARRTGSTEADLFSLPTGEGR